MSTHKSYDASEQWQEVVISDSDAHNAFAQITEADVYHGAQQQDIHWEVATGWGEDIQWTLVHQTLNDKLEEMYRRGQSFAFQRTETKTWYEGDTLHTSVKPTQYIFDPHLMIQVSMKEPRVARKLRRTMAAYVPPSSSGIETSAANEEQ